MGQTEKTPKNSWFEGVVQEFKKISWTDRKSVVKQTIAVVSVSVVVGLIIALMDWLIQYGVNFLLGLSF